MTTLEDLYYGNISPHERYIKRGRRVDKLVKLKYGGMRWKHRAAIYRKSADNGIGNGIGNGNNRNTYRNNTDRGGGRADRGRKEPTSTESKDKATEPTTTSTESTRTKPNTETKPAATTQPTEPSAADTLKENGCITIVETDDPLKSEEPQEEIYQGIQWSKVEPADIERLVIEKVNAYRIAQGDTVTTMLPRLTEVARYRANELTTNFEHRGEQHVSTELKYGQYVDLAPYGFPDDSYYKGYSREAIGMGDWFGTAESMSDRIADGFHNSKEHWSYVGGSKYPYIAVGVTKANGKWYVCILMSKENYGG